MNYHDGVLILLACSYVAFAATAVLLLTRLQAQADEVDRLLTITATLAEVSNSHQRQIMIVHDLMTKPARPWTRGTAGKDYAS